MTNISDEKVSRLDNVLIEKQPSSLLPASLASVSCPASAFKEGKCQSSLPETVTSVAPGSVTRALISSSRRHAQDGWCRSLSSSFGFLLFALPWALRVSSILLPLEIFYT